MSNSNNINFWSNTAIYWLPGVARWTSEQIVADEILVESEILLLAIINKLQISPSLSSSSSLLVSCYCPQQLSSWTSGANHQSGFTFQTVTLPCCVCVTFSVQLLFAKNLFSAYQIFLPGIFFSLLVTVPVVPMIHNTTKVFMFRVLQISTLKYLVSCQTQFALHIYPTILLLLSVGKFYFPLFLSVKRTCGLLTRTCHSNVASPCSHNDLGICKYQYFALSIPTSLHIEYYNCRTFLTSNYVFIPL